MVMTIILPNKIEGLKDLESNLDSFELSEISFERPKTFELVIPR
jgi:hypothetical protein